MILLVEDNQDDEELTLRAFRKNQIPNAIVVARTGEEALGFLLHDPSDGVHRPPRSFRLVLLDLNLPRIGGFEVLRQIRGFARTRLVPVIVLSSSKEDEDVTTSYTLGANSYLCKPTGLAEFVSAVQVIGAFWLSLNILPPA